MMLDSVAVEGDIMFYINGVQCIVSRYIFFRSDGE